METDQSRLKSCSMGLVTVKMQKSYWKFLGLLTQTITEVSTTQVSSIHLLTHHSLEFIAATMSATTFLKDSYLKTAFRMFDTDGNGSIDVKELRTLLSGEEFKDVYTEKQLNAAINEVDVDGNGEIDFEEFMIMMRGV